jgi:hypothetical protein
MDLVSSLRALPALGLGPVQGRNGVSDRVHTTGNSVKHIRRVHRRDVLSVHAELCVSVLLTESAFISVAIRANLRNIRDVLLHRHDRDNWRVITRLVLVGKWRKLATSLEVGRTDWHTHAWQRISLMLLMTHYAEVALMVVKSFVFVVVVAQEIEVFSWRIRYCHFCW